jgi:hypothetical protein
MKRTISGKVAAECKRRDATYEKLLAATKLQILINYRIGKSHIYIYIYNLRRKSKSHTTKTGEMGETLWFQILLNERTTAARVENE